MQKRKENLLKVIKRIIQVAVTLSIMVWLLSRLDWSQGKELLLQLTWWPIAVALISDVICHVIVVSRWKIILNSKSIGFLTLLRIYGTGLFSNNFLPTGIGGDAVRAAMLRKSVPMKVAVFSILFDRILGLVTLVLLLILCFMLGFAFFFDNVMDRYVYWFLGVIIFMIVLTGLLVSLFFLFADFRRKIQSWYFSIKNFFKLPEWNIYEWATRSFFGLFLSIATQIFQAIAVWTIYFSLGTSIPFIASLWVVVLGGLSSVLPISINGIGLTEGIYVFVLESYQIDVTIILMGAFIRRIIALFISIVGGLMSMFKEI